MKSTFKTLFYLKKNEPKKNGHVVIMVRITVDGDQWKSHSTLTLLATQNYPFLLKYDCPLWLK